MQQTLVVMVKAPRPGRVKTRLGREIGMIEAAWWYRRQVASLLRRLRDPRWQLVLAITPDAETGWARVWPHDLERRPQGRGDLGDRMMLQLRAAQRDGPVCLIGSDIPGITSDHISRGFSALRRNDAVFGPALDGGYWMIGLSARRGPPKRLFENVRWSTADALEDNLATLADRPVALVDRLADVDSVQDIIAQSGAI